MGNDLLGQIVVILQLRIDPAHVPPRISVIPHHVHDSLPVVRIDTTHGLTPEVCVLMQRQLSIDLTEVEVYLTLIGEAVADASIRLHMTDPTGLAPILQGILQHTAVLTGIGMHGDTHGLQLIHQRTAGLTVTDGKATGLRPGKMISDVIILFREKTDIVRSGLDLARLKDNILLITLATVNDDTIVAVLNGSSRKHIAAYLIRDKNLPRHSYTANAGTLRDLTRAPKTLTIIGVVILQLLIPGNHSPDLFRTVLDKFIDSLDMADQLSDLNLMAIETLDGQATHGRRVHLIADLAIDVEMDIICNLKWMLYIQIAFHHMIIAMLLEVIIHDMMLDGRTMSDQQTGGKAVAKINT